MIVNIDVAELNEAHETLMKIYIDVSEDSNRFESTYDPEWLMDRLTEVINNVNNVRMSIEYGLKREIINND